ncbi:MAG: GlsB/YeaQ/YmgE family stress response membrane protein [Cellvibrionaceae bacterium]
MSVIIWGLIGVITGAIANKIMPGKNIGGISTAMIIGIAGSIFGGWIGFLSGSEPLELLTINLGSLLSAMVGAYFSLVIFRIIGREYY